jgi:NAD(P)-dependent dehydrogenase (short-subunit alcohol dehydrogenase family)
MSADGLAGRVALVTGALGKLGPVWRAALADVGATVVGMDLRPSDGVLVGDVTDRRSLEQVLRQVVEQHGTPSVLVNNTGIDVPPGERTTPGSAGRST